MDIVEKILDIRLDYSEGKNLAQIVVTCSSQSWFTENIKECATELKSEGKQVAYIVCNEKVISVIGYRENE